MKSLLALVDSSTWLAVATVALLAAAVADSAFVRINPTPPAFTSGSNGTNGADNTGQSGTNGTDQPTPQTGTLNQNGVYTGMDCGKGGDGGSGGTGTPGSRLIGGGKGGNGMEGKRGAQITIYVTAIVTVNGGNGPNGGNGGSGGRGGAGCPAGAGGTAGNGGPKGSINWNTSGSGQLTMNNFVNAVDGTNGTAGGTGENMCE